MSSEQRDQQMQDMFMIRENVSMEYVRLITPTVIHTTANGEEAIHFRSRQAADEQCDILREHGPKVCRYQVITATACAIV